MAGRPTKNTVETERRIAALLAKERVRCAKLHLERERKPILEKRAEIDKDRELLGWEPLSKRDRDRFSDRYDEQCAESQGLTSYWTEDGRVLKIDRRLTTRQWKAIEEKYAKVRKSDLSPQRKKQEIEKIRRRLNPNNYRPIHAQLRFRLRKRFPADPDDATDRTDEQSIFERVAAKFNAVAENKVVAELFGLKPIKPSTVKRYSLKHRDVCEAIYAEAYKKSVRIIALLDYP